MLLGTIPPDPLHCSVLGPPNNLFDLMRKVLPFQIKAFASKCWQKLPRAWINFIDCLTFQPSRKRISKTASIWWKHKKFQNWKVILRFQCCYSYFNVKLDCFRSMFKHFLPHFWSWKIKCCDKELQQQFICRDKRFNGKRRKFNFFKVYKNIANSWRGKTSPALYSILAFIRL